MHSLIEHTRSEMDTRAMCYTDPYTLLLSFNQLIGVLHVCDGVLLGGVHKNENFTHKIHVRPSHTKTIPSLTWYSIAAHIPSTRRNISDL